MLFRNESPALGAATTEQELSAWGSGQEASATALNSNNYKPTTREPLSAVLQATQLTNWMFRAPWTCTVISASVVLETPNTTATTLQAYIVPSASQPEAPSSGNQVFAAAQQLSSATATANTVFVQTLTTSVKNLVLQPGDLLGYTISGASTGLIGLLQVEIVQVG